MNTLRQAIHYINLSAAIILTITHAYRFVDVPWGVLPHYFFWGSYLIELLADKKWQNLRLGRVQLYFAGMAVFFLLAILYYPFDTHLYFKVLLERRYALLGFAIVGFFGLNDKFRLSYFIHALILVSLFNIVYILWHIDPFWKVFNPDNADIFAHTRNRLVNLHMGFNHYLNLSIIGIWYIIKYSWSRLSKWLKGGYVAAMCLFFYFLLISEGRAGFLFSIFLMMSFVSVEVWQKRKQIKTLAALSYPILLLVLFLMATQHDRIKNNHMFRDERVNLWAAAFDVIKESPITGNGMSRAQELFDQASVEHQSPFFKHQRNTAFRHVIIDSHNQFTQTAMEFGIIGVALLGFLLAYPLFIVEKHRRWWAFSSWLHACASRCSTLLS